MSVEHEYTRREFNTASLMLGAAAVLGASGLASARHLRSRRDPAALL
ncbi:MAG: hypothetical protein ACNA8P_13715 [Phycisphaerales bacterium]